MSEYSMFESKFIGRNVSKVKICDQSFGAESFLSGTHTSQTFVSAVSSFPNFN